MICVFSFHVDISSLFESIVVEGDYSWRIYWRCKDWMVHQSRKENADSNDYVQNVEFFSAKISFH